MPRSVNAVASRARRKKVLKLAKGNFGSRGNVWTVAKNTVEKGLQYAYAHRRLKKRTFRSLWITRINAAVRAYGMTYSEFIGKIKRKHAYHSHILTKKTTKQKRNLCHSGIVSSVDEPKLLKLLVK